MLKRVRGFIGSEFPVAESGQTLFTAPDDRATERQPSFKLSLECLVISLLKKTLCYSYSISVDCLLSTRQFLKKQL